MQFPVFPVADRDWEHCKLLIHQARSQCSHCSLYLERLLEMRALEYLTCARKETENTGNIVWFERHATGNKSGNRLGRGRETGNISWF